MEPMTTIALRAARKAGELIVRASDELDQIEVRQKHVNDFVSDIDEQAEQEIIRALRRAYPDADDELTHARVWYRVCAL